MTPPAVLDVIDLRAGYGGLEVLAGVSLRVGRGQFVSVIGPNGAGKSTCLRAIFGLVPARGRVVLDGEDVTNRGPAALLRRGVAFVPQGRNVFPAMTVRENLLLGFHALVPRQRARDRVDWAFETFPMLRACAHQLAGSLSGGQVRVLEVARALMGEPRLLLLDEPSMGLAPQFQRQVFNLLGEIHRLQGVGILLVEQNVAQAAACSDYMYVLEGGRNSLEGPPSAVLADERLRHAYLGRRRPGPAAPRGGSGAPAPRERQHEGGEA
jgi:ABC-type branched-subunit amino acid transport system ATPase component